MLYTRVATSYLLLAEKLLALFGIRPSIELHMSILPLELLEILHALRVSLGRLTPRGPRHSGRHRSNPSTLYRQPHRTLVSGTKAEAAAHLYPLSADVRMRH